MFSHKTIIITISSIIIGSGYLHGASLYYYDAPEISAQLENINSAYHLNADIVYLQSGDECSDQINFSDCIRDTLDDGVDMVFVVNQHLRKMETSLRESVLQALPKAEALRREQAAVPLLQENDIPGAMQAYLGALTSYLDSQCQTYSPQTCTIKDLETAITLWQEQQAEDRARQKLIYMQWFVGLIVLAALLVALISWRQTRQRNINNKNLLQQLNEHSTFLRMTIRQDTLLYEKDKKALLTELTSFDEQLEHLLVSTPDYIHLQLKHNNYPNDLGEIMKQYQSMLNLIGQTDEIQQKIEEIKQINI